MAKGSGELVDAALILVAIGGMCAVFAGAELMARGLAKLVGHIVKGLLP